MTIHEGEVEGQQGDQPADDGAEFSGAWDELSNDDAGQPSDEEGRQGDDGEGEDQGGDDAGQSGDAPPDAAAEQASGETSDDLWANADPRLRSAYEQAENRARQAENQARSNGGRAAQVAKELKELKAALASQKDAGNATGAGDEASDEIERMKQLREEYPDVAAPILDKMARMEATLSELTQGREQAATADTDALLEEQPRLLTEAHADWQQVVQSPEYAEWLERQPPMIQRSMLEENGSQIVNAADCIATLHAFKDERGDYADPATSLAQKRERQLQAGRGVTRGAPAIQRQEEGGSFGDEWDRLEREDKRRASTR